MNPLLDGAADLNQSIAFPLPYRIFFLFGIGILGWATNLHGLEFFEVDSVAALDLRTEENFPTRLPLSQREHALGLRTSANAVIRATYGVFLGYAVLCSGSWMMYRLGTKGDPSLVDAYGHIPAITGLFLILIVWCPYDAFFKTERDKFVQAIRRCLLSSMNTPILFSDVIFADIGTSFAKVFGDIWLSLCMFFPGNTMLSAPVPEGLGRWVVPTLMSVPYFVRLRQCLIEYNFPTNTSRRPFYNAIKYATAFPVIYLSAAQRTDIVDLPSETLHGGLGQHSLFRLWLLAAFVNSAYSFWWDISNDWGFDLLRPEKSAAALRPPPKHSASSMESDYGNSHRPSDIPRSLRPSYPYGLRPILLFPLTVYPLLIFFNLILRMAWSAKLSPHLSARDGSMPVFWLEVAEIVRRWLWTFLRVEWEVVKRIQAAPPVKVEHNGLLSDTDSTLSFDVLTPATPVRPLPDA